MEKTDEKKNYKTRRGNGNGKLNGSDLRASSLAANVCVCVREKVEDNDDLVPGECCWFS